MSQPELPIQPPDTDEAQSRRSDPELLTMGRMLRLLDELDDVAKPRVVNWLYARYYANLRPG